MKLRRAPLSLPLRPGRSTHMGVRLNRAATSPIKSPRWYTTWVKENATRSSSSSAADAKRPMGIG
jgi:hypothetical protein